MVWRAKKLPKLRKGAWFVQTRGSYLPMTWQAWLLYVPYAAYLISTMVLVMMRAENWTDLLPLVPYWIAGVAIMQWIAARKS